MRSPIHVWKVDRLPRRRKRRVRAGVLSPASARRPKAPTGHAGGNAPAVLQVLPRLERDELGRNTLDIARHLRAEGWRSLVASAGGALEGELAAAGVTHLPLPLDATGWFAQRANAGRLA
ncbi:MAG: hypothetical protein WAS21_16465, partial [Geminicoccaceae bacterium]